MRLLPTSTAMPARRPGRGWRPWAWAALIALAGHAWVLTDSASNGLARQRWQAQSPASGAPVLWTRRIDLAATAPVPTAAPGPRVIASPSTSRSPPLAPRTSPAPWTAAPRPAQAAPAPLPPTTADPATAAPHPGPTAMSAPPPGDDAPLTYSTRLPPPFVLPFEWQRGDAAGTAELRFDVDTGGYTLNLHMHGAGREPLGLSSRGRIGPHGLAPEYHATLRRGRERQAAHFDRDARQITYSGPQIVNELQPGAQDRLSWMVQLPAIVEADPTAYAAGARVRLPVSGARGDAAFWDFVVQGRDGALLRLVREPARPYDTRAEVWLDPARGHLPVRVRLAHAPAPGGLELVVGATPRPAP